MRGWSLEEAAKFYTFLEGVIGNKVDIFYGMDQSYLGFSSGGWEAGIIVEIFTRYILGRGVIYCLGYFVGVANLFIPHVAIGGGK